MIPKIIHFVYGLRQDFGGKPFCFAHWAAIKSAIKHNPGYRVIFWHRYQPDNHYFDDIKDQVELELIEPPVDIFGRPLKHVAHQADVVRLLALIQFGGVYLDLDTITTRSFDDLLDNKFVMGEEVANGQRVGLCNAVMLSEPESKFAIAWMNTYRSFRSRGRDAYWNEHSVIMPSLLAEKMLEEITVLPKQAFFDPDWTQPGLEDLFYNSREFPSSYVHHLLESVSWGALSHINEQNVSHIENTYTNLICRDLTHEVLELAERRRQWVSNQVRAGNARLNLGSGSKFDLASINCDLYRECGADLVFDLTRDPWPLPESCAEYAVLHHVMEHLPGDLQHFFAELYRVMKDGGVVDIRVPHPRHDWFLIDPTHVRAWHQESFTFLDRQRCLSWYFGGDSKTPLALYWGVDFEVVESNLYLADGSIGDQLKQSLGPKASVDALAPYLNNVVGEIAVKLRARKGARSEQGA